MQVALENAKKRYGKLIALDAISLDFPEKSVVAVLGLNGAGKSTLLRVMGGVCTLDKGHVRYDNEAFHRERIDLRKRLLFTPEVPFYFPDKSVLRNIAAFLHVFERPTIGREQEIAALMDDMGIAELALREAGRLSRGQTWKMAVACAAAVKPELWLVDEPFASGMDVAGLAGFRKVARGLADAGGTVLYTTQLASLAVEFSDWVLLLNNGQVSRWEKTETIRAQLSQANGDVATLFPGLQETEVTKRKDQEEDPEDEEDLEYDEDEDQD